MEAASFSWSIKGFFQCFRNILYVIGNNPLNSFSGIFSMNQSLINNMGTSGTACVWRFISFIFFFLNMIAFHVLTSLAMRKN